MATFTQSLALDLSALSARATLAPAARVAVKVAFVLMTWEDVYRSRQALKHMTPDRLHDIGLTRQQAMTEARRPFWRT